MFSNNEYIFTYDSEVLDWDQKNRLVGVVNAPNAAGDISYTYDSLNRRTSKVVNGVSTEYLYDGINLIAELDSSSNVIAWYVYSLNVDEPLARIGATGTVHYYHSDILGSTVALTNSSGSVTTQYNYSPFGVTQVIGTDVSQPFRFTGREWDAETGMYYYRARYYSPSLARFITEDPIRYQSGDVNWYRYVNNNPINNIDPLGWAWIGLRALEGVEYLRIAGFVHPQIFFDDGTESIGFFNIDGIFTGTGDFLVEKPDLYDRTFENLCDAVMHEAVYRVKATWNRNYNLITNNCQDFVEAVLDLYNDLMGEAEN
jgi:RHS repeat-associated protein